jgi:hypothetical protein
MGSHFRKMAQAAEQSGDQSPCQECMQAADLMDREAVNEMTVLGTRYRVVRADRFIRTGPAGPEPPRPSDGDPGQPRPQLPVLFRDPGPLHRGEPVALMAQRIDDAPDPGR